MRQTGPTSEVVSAYELAMSSNERSNGERKTASGYKARFNSWEISMPEGESRHVLRTINPVKISFYLDVRQPIRRAHHGIALFDMERRLLWAFSTDGLSFPAGVHKLHYTLPFLPLPPGSYAWQLSLWDESGNVDLWEASPEMIVAAPNYQHSLDEWNGLMNLPSSLQVEECKGS